MVCDRRGRPPTAVPALAFHFRRGSPGFRAVPPRWCGACSNELFVGVRAGRRVKRAASVAAACARSVDPPARRPARLRPKASHHAGSSARVEDARASPIRSAERPRRRVRSPHQRCGVPAVGPLRVVWIGTHAAAEACLAVREVRDRLVALGRASGYPTAHVTMREFAKRAGARAPKPDTRAIAR